MADLLKSIKNKLTTDKGKAKEGDKEKAKGETSEAPDDLGKDERKADSEEDTQKLNELSAKGKVSAASVSDDQKSRFNVLTKYNLGVDDDDEGLIQDDVSFLD